MSDKLIFGFLPDDGTGSPTSIAVSMEKDFTQHGCMSYEYPDNIQQMFGGWEAVGITPIMDSIFEYPKGKQEFIKTYLEYNGVKHDSAFQTFLNRSMV